MEKTLKREVAIALVAFWAAMTVWGVFEPRAAAAAEFMMLGVFVYLAGAMGVDAAAKQILPAMKAKLP